MEDLTGKRIGRYEFIQLIGSGGMGCVYRVYDHALAREAALKMILVDEFPRSQIPKLRKRFHREAQMMAQFNEDSNIVHVFDLSEDDGIEGNPYMTMQLIEGNTLQSMLLFPIPYQEAAKILIPIADALGRIHKKGIVHRDIKPSNIMIRNDGVPILMDFGISKRLAEDSGNKSQLTQAGTAVGTAYYMSPEQATEEHNIDGRADEYSLGVIFYEMITSERLFDGATNTAIMMQHCNADIPFAKDIITDLPGDVDVFIHKAVAKKPEDRFATMEDFSAALKVFADRSADDDFWASFRKAEVFSSPGNSNPSAANESTRTNNAPSAANQVTASAMLPAGKPTLIQSADTPEDNDVGPDARETVASESIAPGISGGDNEPGTASKKKTRLISAAAAAVLAAGALGTLYIRERNNSTQTPLPAVQTVSETVSSVGLLKTAETETAVITETNTPVLTDTTVMDTNEPVMSDTDTRIMADTTDTSTPTETNLIVTDTSTPVLSGTSAADTNTPVAGDSTVRSTGTPIDDDPQVTDTNTPTKTVTPSSIAGLPVVPEAAAPSSAAKEIAATATNTEMPTPTNTETSAATNTLTETGTPTATDTATVTNIPTATNTNTPTITNTATATDTPTATSTDTPTATNTPAATEMPTATNTNTATAAPTETDTPTATDTAVPSETPTPMDPALESLYAHASDFSQIGTIVEFGSYEQDNDTSNGKEPIEWIVLDVKKVRSLLISRYGLDAKPYNNIQRNVTWETSFIRDWLNYDFLDEAFSSEWEKSLIRSSMIINSGNRNVDGGVDTNDKIFLLSSAEANKYFSSNTERKCVVTDYAHESQGATLVWDSPINNQATSWWWLRSPGNSNYTAAYVSSTGEIKTDGYAVDENPGTHISVRPALWIDLKKLGIQ